MNHERPSVDDEQPKKKQKVVSVKEIKLRPGTEIHDYNFKLNHAKKFLEDGSKLKAYVFFKGRSIIHKERGEILLLKLAQDLEVNMPSEDIQMVKKGV